MGTIRILDTVTDAQIDALADVLIDCVEGDASVGFMSPLTRDRVVAFWRRVAHGVTSRERVLWSPKSSRVSAAPSSY